MAVSVQKIGIVPAVIVALELQELGSSGVGAGQTKGEHGGFAAGVGEADSFCRRNHAAETLGCVDLSGGGGGKMRAFGDCLRNSLDDSRMRVTLDECPKRHHEINVFVAIGV